LASDNKRLIVFTQSQAMSDSICHSYHSANKNDDNLDKFIKGNIQALSTVNMVSLGVTILTVYGAKLWDAVSGAKAKEEALKKTTKAIEDKNKAESEANENLARFQSDEISKSKLLFENAKNISLSYSERSKAIKDLRERYPDYIKGLSDEKLLAGDTAKAENELNNALLKRGVALAAAEEIQKIVSKNLINEKKHSDDLLKIEEERSKVAVTAIDPFTKNKKEQLY